MEEPRMTEAELIQFLQERGRTPSQIEQIMQPVSHEEVIKLLRINNLPTDSAIVEVNASILRAKIAKIIFDSNDQGIPWDLAKKFLQ